MRIRMAFLSCTVVAMAALLAPTAVLATGSGYSCSTFTPNIAIVEGPCPVIFNDPLGPSCERPGDATGIKYQNSGTLADHLATLVTVNNNVGNLSGCQLYSACSGDPLTGLGKYSCHEQAIKINPANQTVGFWVVAQATAANKTQRLPVLTSIVAKKGSCIKSKAILGLGLEAPVTLAKTTKKTTKVGACEATLSTPATGPETFDLADDAPPECVVVDNGVPLADVTITTPGHSGTGLEAEEFSFVSKGSCCYSTVSRATGKLYTVCNTSVATCQ